MVRFGPSVILVALGLYLFHKTKKQPVSNKRTADQITAPDTRQWFSGYDIWRLADAEVLKIADNFGAEVRRTQQKIAEIENERRELRTTPSGLGALSELSPAMAELENRASEARTLYAASEQQLIAANEKIVENLYEKLASGKLIASGFHHPVGANPSYTEIPAAEWRILRFSIGNKEAEGQGIKYVGITVAKA